MSGRITRLGVTHSCLAINPLPTTYLKETRAVRNPYCNLKVIMVWSLSHFQSLLVSALSDPQNLTGST